MKNRTRRWLRLARNWGIAIGCLLFLWILIILIRPNVNYAMLDKYFHHRRIEAVGEITATHYIEDVCDPDTEITKYAVSDLMAGRYEDIHYTDGLYILNDRYFINGEDFDSMLTTTEIEGYGTVTMVRGAAEALEALLAAAETETGTHFILGDSYIDGAVPEKDVGNDCYMIDYYDTSEHITGTSVDLLLEDETFRTYMTSDAAKWLQDNAWRFGYIIRYPFWEGEWTGVFFQPWHLHYVGQPHAANLYASRMPLEEYVEKTYDRKQWYFQDFTDENGMTKTYVTFCQTAYDGEIYIPDTLSEVEVSFDNTWQYYYVTGVLNRS